MKTSLLVMSALVEGEVVVVVVGEDVDAVGEVVVVGRLSLESRVAWWHIREKSRTRLVVRIIIGDSSERRRLRGEVGCLVDMESIDDGLHLHENRDEHFDTELSSVFTISVYETDL